MARCAAKSRWSGRLKRNLRLSLRYPPFIPVKQHRRRPHGRAGTSGRAAGPGGRLGCDCRRLAHMFRSLCIGFPCQKGSRPFHIQAAWATHHEFEQVVKKASDRCIHNFVNDLNACDTGAGLCHLTSTGRVLFYFGLERNEEIKGILGILSSERIHKYLGFPMFQRS
ncbi:hypothetical protein VNO78_11340 [Psophocarpus tetragonolobus]|uniref:Uncharacterized protein n=1 Tax=Psophocarpus tetragonolobus TaxID=3891 RepID=A0AAN9SNS9_PSOTE